MPKTSDLPFLIRLLDDDDPAVVPVVSKQLAGFGGDISQDLAALGIEVPESRKKKLSSLLAAGRRKALSDEWLVPSGGVSAWEDDWDSFEHSLRLLSDFLHDGVTLRPALPDCLDMLADEADGELAELTAAGLRDWLFAKGRFKGARKQADACEYFDLCHVMDVFRGNPTSLACLFMLAGRRLGVQVDGCSYPGHFLARIRVEGSLTLVDCFHRGRSFDVDALLEKHPEISQKAREAVMSQGHLGLILHRYVSEIRSSLAASGRDEDAQFFSRILETMQP